MEMERGSLDKGTERRKGIVSIILWLLLYLGGTIALALLLLVTEVLS